MLHDPLKVFITLVHLGSFSRTAQSYSVDPAQISRCIARLEQRLACRLFIRSTRKLRLTADGKRFYQRIQPLINDLDDAIEEVADQTQGLSGKVRMSAPTSLGQQLLVPLVQSFQQTYPDIQLEMILTNQNLDLIEQGIDLTIRTGAQIEQNYVCKKLWDTQYRFCASTVYLQKLSKPLTQPQQISQFPLLMYPERYYHQPWVFTNSKGEQQLVEVSPKVTISDSMSIKQLMLAGVGMGFLAHWIIDEEIKQGKCKALFSDYRIQAPVNESKTWIIYPNRQYQPKRVRTVLAFIEQQLQRFRY